MSKKILFISKGVSNQQQKEQLLRNLVAIFQAAILQVSIMSLFN